MSVLDQAKELASLIKKVGDIEMYRQIVELEGEIIELTRTNRSLEESNSSLQKQLQLRSKMLFKQPFYFQEDDEVPFCPLCWEKEQQTIHLGSIPPQNPSTYVCTACGLRYELRRYTDGKSGWVPDKKIKLP